MLVLLVVLAVVVLAGGIGIAAWLQTVDRGTDTDPGVARALWTTPLDSNPASYVGDANAFLVQDAVVVVRSDGLHAYSQKTGKPVWEVLVPGENTQMCSVSFPVVNGTVAVAYGIGNDCTHVMAVDVRAGIELWHSRFVPEENYGVPVGVIPVVFGDLADAIFLASDEYVAFFNSLGELLYAGRLTPVAASKGCRIEDVRAVQEAALVLKECYSGKSPLLQKIDMVSGEVVWSHVLHAAPVPSDLINIQFLSASASPILVFVDTDNGSYILSFDGSGSLLAKIPSRGKGGELDLFDIDELQPSVLVSGTTLIARAYTQGVGKRGYEQRVSHVVAINLTNGKRRWVVSRGPQWSVTLLEASRDSVLVAARNTAMGDPKLLRISVDKGSISTVATYDAAIDVRVLDALLVQDRRLFIYQRDYLAAVPIPRKPAE